MGILPLTRSVPPVSYRGTPFLFYYLSTSFSLLRESSVPYRGVRFPCRVLFVSSLRSHSLDALSHVLRHGRDVSELLGQFLRTEIFSIPFKFFFFLCPSRIVFLPTYNCSNKTHVIPVDSYVRGCIYVPLPVFPMPFSHPGYLSLPV